MRTFRRFFTIAAFMLALSGPALIVLTPGCSTSQQTVTYQTLASIGATVDAAMKTAAQLEVLGKITSSQWATIADAHSKFLVAYNAAISAAVVAVDKATVPADVLKLSNDLLALVSSFTGK